MASSKLQRQERVSEDDQTDRMTDGISAGPNGVAIKGRFESPNAHDKEMGWGVIRLFRDAQETKGLYEAPASAKVSKTSHTFGSFNIKDSSTFRDEDCTILCILAVPSYLTPSDFLGFVGEKTREDVSHFRMIRTERSNRYMVLMKFRDGKRARQWRREWNGKAFDGMEPENCHVVFLKSIEFQSSSISSDQAEDGSSFPDMRNDPFTPTASKQIVPMTAVQPVSSTAVASRTSKPMAPPTPALVELPTCPVCLERMDESTGLLTILCQHVFHCSCLQKWRGSGCPVCRYTQDGPARSQLGLISDAQDTKVNECNICRQEDNLWICLICGNVGCGRYEAAHAFAHYDDTKHSFAMDMTTQRVWDYASDGYVHRILQDRYDGKFVEVESSMPTDSRAQTPDDYSSQAEHVPATKINALSLEYSSLLTSQLDSQRQYYSSLLRSAADKASSATAAADDLALTTSKLESQMHELRIAMQNLESTVLPELQKDRDREARKAEKYLAMARKLEGEWRDEKALTKGLLNRSNGLERKVAELEHENADLKDQSHDLMFMLEGREKIKELEKDGSFNGIEGGDIGIPETKVRDPKGKMRRGQR